MRARLRRIAISCESPEGTRYQGEVRFGDNLTVVSGVNAFGKSTLAIAVPWCLGTEPLFGLSDNDSSRFPPSIRDALETPGGPEARVATSRAEIEIERLDGEALLLRRDVLGGDPTVIAVDRRVAGGGPVESFRMAARALVMRDGVAGFQGFFFDWLGMPRTSLMTTKGKAYDVYLENILPLVYIDQAEGWSDVQALQIRRYQQIDVQEAVVEYLLGASAALERRRREQEAVFAISRLKSEAVQLAEEIGALFRSAGWVWSPSTHGQPAELADRWRQRSLAEVARSDFSFRFEEEAQRLEQRVGELRRRLAEGDVDPRRAGASSEASQRVLHLKSDRAKFQAHLRMLREQQSDQQGLEAAIAARRESARHLLRLKQRNVGRMPVVPCPTCSQPITPRAFSMSLENEASLVAEIEALEREIKFLESSLRATTSEIVSVGATLSALDESLLDAQRTFDVVNMAVGTVREQMAESAAALVEAERELAALRKFKQQLTIMQERVDEWIRRAASIGEVALESDEDIQRRVLCFEGHLRRILLALGHSAVREANAAEVRIREDYAPYLGARRLRSLGSASDHPRLVAAYALALAEASLELGGPHPGFVVLDEPLQQNPDERHIDLVLRFLEGAARNLRVQTIVFTSLREPELVRVRASEVSLIELAGEHLLVPR